ncbi:MAG: hypothetical protein B6U85_03425 [Desulfurococcales archaeon ex4484_42]|nr:MAG: hypothetical protein B6U85_03425 [Desulfurococcales archaeon ex4484_42]
MPVDMEYWRKWKEEMLSRLKRDIDVGYLDEDIKDILLKFFQNKHTFTISSCSGRITLIDGPQPWDRKNSTIVFKKHEPITSNEVKEMLTQRVLHKLWLVVTGPIIHVCTDSIKEALKVLKLAREAGMKHSGILSMSKRGIIVELRTGVRLAILLKIKDEIVIDENKLHLIVRAANEALLEGKERLNRLRVKLGLRPHNYNTYITQ